MTWLCSLPSLSSCARPSGPLVSLAWCGDVLCAARGTALVTWRDGKRRSVAVPGPVTALEARRLLMK